VVPTYLLSLGYDAFIVGLVIAAQYLTTFLTRGIVGNAADILGSGRVVFGGFYSPLFQAFYTLPAIK
jgi:hypothetical protein